MDIVLRTINLNDAEAAAHLSKQLGYEISAIQIIDNITAIIESKNDEAFVAIHENKVVGWIGVAYTIILESLPSCVIRGLIVDEKYRKKNIGKMLIEKAKQWCAEKNCSRLRVRCNVTRKDTHAFYLHLGFTEKKEQKVFEIEV
ncbi:MAG: GNAT family N-acetyltransferase [Parafilimonas sp.]